MVLVIAATAPIIDADDDEVAQLFLLFLFQCFLAALLFPMFGHFLGFDTTSGEAFVYLPALLLMILHQLQLLASTWDSMWNLELRHLIKPLQLSFTRTLAIIPITLVLALFRAKQSGSNSNEGGFSFKKAFPMFILWFIVASLITTIAIVLVFHHQYLHHLKSLVNSLLLLPWLPLVLAVMLSSFYQKWWQKPILVGGCCWIGITCVSLLLQHVLSIW